MVRTSLPQFNMDRSATGCCPRFDPAGWDEQEFEFHQWLFVRATTVNVLLYFFYTTCPRCAKVYGQNYVVAFAAVSAP